MKSIVMKLSSFLKVAKMKILLNNVFMLSIASVSWLKLDGQFRYFKWQST